MKMSNDKQSAPKMSGIGWFKGQPGKHITPAIPKQEGIGKKSPTTKND